VKELRKNRSWRRTVERSILAGLKKVALGQERWHQRARHTGGEGERDRVGGKGISGLLSCEGEYLAWGGDRWEEEQQNVDRKEKKAEPRSPTFRAAPTSQKRPLTAWKKKRTAGGRAKEGKKC